MLSCLYVSFNIYAFLFIIIYKLYSFIDMIKYKGVGDEREKKMKP